MLRGSASEKIRRFGHDELPIFGAGAELSANEWRSVARQLAIAGLIQVDADRFNAVLLTEASRAVLKGESRVGLRKWREEAPPAARRRGGAGGSRGAGAGGRNGGRDAVAVDLDAAASEVFQRLRAWRAGQAQTAGVPAYVIFHDATLREIAQNQPKDRDQLAAIPGIGVRKLESYGEVLLQTVRGA